MIRSTAIVLRRTIFGRRVLAATLAFCLIRPAIASAEPDASGGPGLLFTNNPREFRHDPPHCPVYV
ncbi:MAG: hypothetical protein H0X34_04420 [Chthoniobacterales bacterium]|nr:hypothetical protein [Chthoniobacterales bacterium]